MLLSFFPACEDPLEGCPQYLEAARQFGNFAGDWACIAVLLEGDGTGARGYKPKFIGLTSRNPGVIPFLGDSRRTGMLAFDWQEARPQVVPLEVDVRKGTIGLVAEHPRIFVARGNHGLYLRPGDQPAPAFSPDDPSRTYCGTKEALNGRLVDEPSPGGGSRKEGFPYDKHIQWWEWALAFAIPGIGIPIIAGHQFSTGLDVRGRPNPLPPQTDHPPNPGMIGKVIHPQGVDPLDVNPDAVKIPWPMTTNANDLSSTIDGRLYSLLVDRTKQIWWPKEGQTPGFTGRRGPRVTHDPNDRRAGMFLENYWDMFLLALAKKLSL